ncbi:uncharacterized protein B0J16DRAFT_336142 [Fusarium flagelliforme]|uniref:uncharacterized protein n=1 Tax=Fusarium flagelliforme TaxID=2675880 RepID=UPI001E8D4FC5|nr:uncharacterized protein B0J16DRAFT_336142 [Fusarium flagelliforme]KAH7193854.1 hypothetical protein B0J16DRAFT_336142 [Fusarium flagelliforme]
MRRLSREEVRRGEEARRLARREEKNTEKEKPEPLIEPFRSEQSHDVPPSWEADNQPETAPNTKTQIKGKGEAQDEGAWSSHAWPQSESTADKEPSTNYFLYSMPSTSQSIMDYPDYNVPGPLQYQSYPMTNGPQATWYDPPGYAEPAASQPSPDYSDCYSPASPKTCSGGCSTAERSRDEITFSCPYPECTSRPFKRNADLQRHYKRTHSDEPDSVYSCDCRGCFREGEPFHRLDHFRDHLRQYHGEDIPRRGASSAMRSEKTTWWRCTRCLVRVYVSQHGFECPNCETESRLEGKHSQSGSLQKGS